VVLPAVRDLRIDAQMKPKLFHFGTYNTRCMSHRDRRPPLVQLSDVSPFTFISNDGARYINLTVYLSFRFRTFYLDINWPLKAERINGVPL
jgi:hypothetical protein